MKIQKKIKTVKQTVKQKKKNPQTTRVRGFFCGGLDGSRTVSVIYCFTDNYNTNFLKCTDLDTFK